jgi:GAF domain-containing protein
MADLTDITTAERELFEALDAGAPLLATLERIVSVIEEHADERLLGSILLLDEDGVHLRHGAAPSLPEAYNAAIDGIAIGPTVGSCGTAVHRREPVIVVDIASDPLWRDFRDLALSHGLRSCWSTPIFSDDDDVLGTFAMY